MAGVSLYLLMMMLTTFAVSDHSTGNEQRLASSMRSKAVESTATTKKHKNGTMSTTPLIQTALNSSNRQTERYIAQMTANSTSITRTTSKTTKTTRPLTTMTAEVIDNDDVLAFTAKTFDGSARSGETLTVKLGDKVVFLCVSKNSSSARRIRIETVFEKISSLCKAKTYDACSALEANLTVDYKHGQTIICKAKGKGQVDLQREIKLLLEREPAAKLDFSLSYNPKDTSRPIRNLTITCRVNCEHPKSMASLYKEIKQKKTDYQKTSCEKGQRVNLSIQTSIKYSDVMNRASFVCEVNPTELNNNQNHTRGTKVHSYSKMATIKHSFSNFSFGVTHVKHEGFWKLNLECAWLCSFPYETTVKLLLLGKSHKVLYENTCDMRLSSDLEYDLAPSAISASYVYSMLDFRAGKLLACTATNKRETVTASVALPSQLQLMYEVAGAYADLVEVTVPLFKSNYFQFAVKCSLRPGNVSWTWKLSLLMENFTQNGSMVHKATIAESDSSVVELRNVTLVYTDQVANYRFICKLDQFRYASIGTVTLHPEPARVYKMAVRANLGQSTSLQEFHVGALGQTVYLDPFNCSVEVECQGFNGFPALTPQIVLAGNALSILEKESIGEKRSSLRAEFETSYFHANQSIVCGYVNSTISFHVQIKFNQKNPKQVLLTEQPQKIRYEKDDTYEIECSVLGGWPRPSIKVYGVSYSRELNSCNKSVLWCHKRFSVKLKHSSEVKCEASSKPSEVFSSQPVLFSTYERVSLALLQLPNPAQRHVEVYIVCVAFLGTMASHNSSFIDAKSDLKITTSTSNVEPSITMSEEFVQNKQNFLNKLRTIFSNRASFTMLENTLDNAYFVWYALRVSDAKPQFANSVKFECVLGNQSTGKQPLVIRHESLMTETMMDVVYQLNCSFFITVGALCFGFSLHFYVTPFVFSHLDEARKDRVAAEYAQQQIAFKKSLESTSQESEKSKDKPDLTTSSSNFATPQQKSERQPEKSLIKIAVRKVCVGSSSPSYTVTITYTIFCSFYWYLYFLRSEWYGLSKVCSVFSISLTSTSLICAWLLLFLTGYRAYRKKIETPILLHRRLRG